MILIIVFGVSGVGKTTLCEAFAAHHPEFLHLTASKLIAMGTASAPDDLRWGSPKKILQNQSVLLDVLEKEVERLKKTKVILDGQCVIDNGTEIVVLPAETIGALQPCALILLESTPEEINRRRLESKRQRPVRTPEELSIQMEMNRSAVAKYASQLKIPYRIVNVEGPLTLEPIVRDLVNPC